MKVAVLSDIHSNLLALEAVWQDLQAQGPDLVVCLGDHLWGSLEPREVADFLMAHPITCISGNQDREIWQPSGTPGPDLPFLLQELDTNHLQWLQNLPATQQIGGLLLCHGTPTSDTTYLLETVTPQGARLATATEVSQRLGEVQAEVVLCGHSHLARVVQAGEVLVVNPGSVGMPAYDDNQPFVHVMESGSPHARYATLHQQKGHWHIQQHQVPYDWTRAAQQAAAKGRPDRARWLGTGRV